MVSFRSLATAAIAFCAVPTLAALTVKETVDSIELLTSKSELLQRRADNVTVVNGTLLIAGQGPYAAIITAYEDITRTVAAVVSKIEDTPTIDQGDDADAIYYAFREFVEAQQAVLDTLANKAEEMLQVVRVIGTTLITALSHFQNEIGTFESSLADYVQGRTEDLQAQSAILDAALTNAIEKYDALRNTVKRQLPALRNRTRAYPSIA